MAAKTVKEKAAPVAPAVAPVVLGVGAAVKKGESAVIESSEDIPSEMARSSSSSSSSSSSISIGETLDKGESLDCPCSGKPLSLGSLQTFIGEYDHNTTPYFSELVDRVEFEEQMEDRRLGFAQQMEDRRLEFEQQMDN